MFITFEGTDGSGKSTALNKIADYLQENNINFVLTREPGTKISKENELLRELIVSMDSKLSDMSEALLFSADRRLHLEKLIWPSLKEGKLVICDRYIDSTFAYQGNGRGLGIEKMIELQEIVTDKTYPDLTIYFDVSPSISQQRVTSRGEINRMEVGGVEFAQKVYDGYQKLVKMFPQRIRVVDASKSPEEVFNQVKTIFEQEVL